MFVKFTCAARKNLHSAQREIFLITRSNRTGIQLVPYDLIAMTKKVVYVCMVANFLARQYPTTNSS